MLINLHSHGCWTYLTTYFALEKISLTLYSFHCQHCFCLEAVFWVRNSASGKGIWLHPVERMRLDAIWPLACDVQSRLHGRRSKSQSQLLPFPSFPLDLVKPDSQVFHECTFSAEHVSSTYDFNECDNQWYVFIFPSCSSSSSDFAMHRFDRDSEVYKMIQENKESRTAPRQSNTFKMLQEVLEADERGWKHAVLQKTERSTIYHAIFNSVDCSTNIHSHILLWIKISNFYVKLW